MTRAAIRPPELPGYEHIDDLGSGGYADVYLYEQAMPRRRVAVKVLRAESLTDELAMQFQSEANLMAALSTHPYIVTIYGAAVSDDGRPYIVMEYYPGPNLSVRSRQKPLSIPEAVRIGVQLAGAVETAHRAGILHRDLKPANVLTSAFGKPGLTDFGISAVAGEVSGAAGLSVPWSPPEALDDAGDVDARSDVWSLAATIYTLLSGHSPFEIPGGDNSALAVMSRIEHQPPTPIKRSEVPASLERALGAAMSKSPAVRPATAAEFARMLQSVERDLRLQPTDLDIPDEGPAEPSASPAGGAWEPDPDGTRFRGARSVVAQPVAPAPDRSFAPPPPRPPSPPPAAEADGRTVRRASSSVDEPAAPAAPAPSHAVPEQASSRGNGRLKALAVVAILVLAVAGVVGVNLAGRGSSRSNDAATGFDPGSVNDQPSASAALGPPEFTLAVKGTGAKRVVVASWAAADGTRHACQATVPSTQYRGKQVSTDATSCQLPAPGADRVCVVVTRLEPATGVREAEHCVPE